MVLGDGEMEFCGMERKPKVHQKVEEEDGFWFRVGKVGQLQQLPVLFTT
jgi:hypothetical protein